MRQLIRTGTQKVGLAILCSVLLSSLSSCEGGSTAETKSTFLRSSSSSRPADSANDEVFNLLDNKEDADQMEDEFAMFELVENEETPHDETAVEEATGRRKLAWYITLWTALHPPHPPGPHHHSSGSGGSSGGSGGSGGNGGGSGGSGDSSGGSGGSGDSSGGSGGSSGGSGGSGGSSGGSGDSGSGISSWWQQWADWAHGNRGNESSGESGSSSSYSTYSNNGGSSGTGGGTDTGGGVQATKQMTQSTSMALMFVAACAGTVAIAAILVGQRQVSRPRSHALHGAVKNRMRLFSGFADKALCSMKRPPREVEMSSNQEGSSARYELS